MLFSLLVLNDINISIFESYLKYYTIYMRLNVLPISELHNNKPIEYPKEALIFAHALEILHLDSNIIKVYLKDMVIICNS